MGICKCQSICGRAAGGDFRECLGIRKKQLRLLSSPTSLEGRFGWEEAMNFAVVPGIQMIGPNEYIDIHLAHMITLD